MKYLPWALAVMAVWLIAAPFLLGYAQTEPAMRNDVSVGVVMLVGACFWGFSELRTKGWGATTRTEQRR